MKKEYMKPAMQVVEIQKQQIICVSPVGSRTVPFVRDNSSDTLYDEDIDDII